MSSHASAQRSELLQRFHAQPRAEAHPKVATRLTPPASSLALPTRPGSYCWYYADVTAGDTTAVFIFMVGSVFSPSYSKAARHGGHPQRFSAVNHALYRRGRRVRWVYSEYPEAHLEAAQDGGFSLRIGRSRFTTLADGEVRIQLEDRTAPWGRPAQARAVLRPEGASAPEQQLVHGQPHFWRALMPRGHATLELPEVAGALQGRAYHDANRGEELLGAGLPGWQWVRIHLPEHTLVWYRLPQGSPSIQVRCSARDVEVHRSAESELSQASTFWGLRVPRVFLPSSQPRFAMPGLLESSPFYARLESHADSFHALAEVADFRRFHSPWVRWMAHFRMRQGAGP